MEYFDFTDEMLDEMFKCITNIRNSRYYAEKETGHNIDTKTLEHFERINSFDLVGIIKELEKEINYVDK